MRLVVLLPSIISRFPQQKFSFMPVATFRRLSSVFSNMEITNDDSDVCLPPPHVKGMKSLNRDAFAKQVSVPFVEVPHKQIDCAIKKLKSVLLRIPKFKPVVEGSNGKIIFLNPSLIEVDSKTNSKALTFLQEIGFNNDSFKDVVLGYDNFTYKDILKAILPKNLGMGASGFSIIGHILHLNLKEPFQDYRHIIGQVLLDKHPSVKTVVNKTNTINNTFRNFEMEVLAGEPNFEVEVKENGHRFQMDFSKVFWNPRLMYEHAEVSKRLLTNDLVFDVFAGVGPFAIPAAKKKCIVYANDLNPHSYSALLSNAKLNKVSQYVQAYNLDGREFIQTVVKDELVKFYCSTFDKTRNIYIVMNLPAYALEFLDSFKNLLNPSDLSVTHRDQMPIVYCYFFVKTTSEECTTEMVLNKYLNNDMQKCILEIKPVREVSTNKTMYRLVFTLPFSVLCGEIISKEIDKNSFPEPNPKKLKIA